MKVSRFLIAILAVAVFSIVVSMLTCGSTFSWVYKLEPTNVWKPMEQIPMPVILLTTFLLDAIFVYVYTIIKNGVPGKNKYIKGLAYGLIVWAVGMIPGMISTYLFMTIATTVVIYWTVLGLIMSPLKGLIAAAIYGE